MILVLGSAENEQHDDENVFNENNSEQMKYFFSDRDAEILGGGHEEIGQC